jgi:putative IMPACT (imprinted ancient) family translation regulator
MKRYTIPAQETRTEITVINSRFIATIKPVFKVSEAKVFIKRMKTEFKDASHNVPAYVVGHDTTVIAHCNDDGEPSGTAGRPALAVLQGSGIGDAAVVVTRYFGGTKLGAEKIPTHSVMVVLPYKYYERVKLLIQANHGKILDEDFAGDITLTSQFAEANFNAYQIALSEMSHGTLIPEIIETNPETIIPLGSL